MGTWRTVKLKGKIAPKDAPRAIEYLTVRQWESKACNDGVYYLQFGESVYGINKWINNDGSIDKTGTLYERDCDNDDLLKELIILAKEFPTLDMVLHSGSIMSDECTATFIIKNGFCVRVEPQIPTL